MNGEVLDQKKIDRVEFKNLIIENIVIISRQEKDFVIISRQENILSSYPARRIYCPHIFRQEIYSKILQIWPCWKKTMSSYPVIKNKILCSYQDWEKRKLNT